MWSNWSSHTLLEAMQNDTTALEGSLQLLVKFNRPLPRKPSNPTLRWVSSLLFKEASQRQHLALPGPKATSSCPWAGTAISGLSYYGQIWVQYLLVLLGGSSPAQGSGFEGRLASVFLKSQLWVLKTPYVLVGERVCIS